MVPGGGTTTTRTFVHAGDMEIAEYVDGALVARYVPGAGVDQRIAMVTSACTGKTSSCANDTVYFYHPNRLGSILAVSDNAGTLADQYIYTPFGLEEPLVTSGNPFRYTGRKFDQGLTISNRS